LTRFFQRRSSGSLHASERARPPYIQKLWLVLENEVVKSAMDRIALLRDSLRSGIDVYEIDDDWQKLVAVPIPERSKIFKQRLARFPRVSEPEISDWTKALMKKAPAAIDLVHARHGETLRYFGLPFARVRRLMGVDRVWFGVEGSRRRMLDAGAEHDWASLFGN